MDDFLKQCSPQCDPAAEIRGENYRLTVLTPALLRLEYCPGGQFEDRPTQTVLNRQFPVPAFHTVRRGGMLHLFTDALHLVYDEQAFSANGLKIQATESGGAWENTWHYGEDIADLKGTARTLDQSDGAIPLEHGLISRRGFSVLDDSSAMVLTDDPQAPAGMWVAPRAAGVQDLYFFGYGHRYQDCLRDFYHLCGGTPLLPRWAFGNWWSRYHKYDEGEYKALMTRFETEHLPFSVAVLDMDWHLVDIDPRYGAGWTGYTWNKDFFPDPPELLDWLHGHNMKVTLNVHPADGVRAFEDAYPKMAARMGVENGDPVEFDPADPAFMNAYFEDLHHPLEDEGVDFWWVDWQQGNTSKLPGLDPLWMLNHYHYLDSARRGARPLTFSRYAGPGSHRYPVGFSGDSAISWASLQFQPYFTATASNIGYGWWSHDIGGHMNGIKDDELATRWVQFGVFSPMNRLHSTDNPFNGKEPWNFNPIACGVMEQFLRLRHRLIPYLYTMNRIASRDGQPLIRPLYWLEPDNDAAYEAPNAYYYGTELLCAPITTPADHAAGLAGAAAWLPAGLWFDFFSGRVYRGGRSMTLWRPLEAMPVLAKAGGIVPMQDMAQFTNSTANPAAMELCVFPGQNGRFTLWEDAGDTPGDKDENWAATELTYQDGSAFTIAPAAGNTAVLPQKRSWLLHLRGVQNAAVRVTANGAPLTVETAYDAQTRTLTVPIPATAITAALEIRFPAGLAVAENDLAGETYRILDRAQIEFNLKTRIYSLVTELGAQALPSLTALHLAPALFGALCEVLMAD